MYYTTTYDSPLGEIMIAADSKGIAGLWIQGQKYFEDMGKARSHFNSRVHSWH